eukprot:gene7851-9665_t
MSTTSSTTDNILQFKEFSSLVNISFWNELSTKKLDIFKLSEEPVPINGYYSFSHSQQIDPFLCLEFNSFLPSPSSSSSSSDQQVYRTPPRSYLAPGTLYNFNTSEDFKQIWKDIITGQVDKDPSLLCRFLLLTYADIKNHSFYYMFAFPALSPSPVPITSESESSLPVANQLLNEQQYKSLVSKLPLPQFFLLKKMPDGSEVQIGGLDQWSLFYGNNSDDEIPIVGFNDPSSLPSNPGWPLRNFLVYLNVRFGVKKVTVLCYRESQRPSLESLVYFTLSIPTIEKTPQWTGKSFGWEKDSKGKILPRNVSLASTMDPLKLASQSVDLNLKLMRWRVMPSLNLELIHKTKCLLLGSGTLGCNVARCLMSWGVKNITFVDSSKVSYSNPVRQSLFNFSDCSPKSKEKAVAAAESLKNIFPAINSQGVVMTIPMPGHSVPSNEVEKVKSDFEKLESLIKDHDFIFLLTDSRESRWLPTLLCRYYNKPLINTALGFDSFLVIRHGQNVPHPSECKGNEGSDLGCYFCNDVIAPSDTLKDRTLDQQCTVTRPGLSMIASAIAIELMVSILHHPLMGRAQPETQTDIYGGSSTPLGIIPHQLRGFLSHYQTLPLFGNPYKNCTACSQPILEQFKERGFEFVLQVLNDSSCLTSIAGIDALKEEQVNIDWDELSLSDNDEDNDENDEKYEATETEELTLEEGDIVDILEEADDGWWKGYSIKGNIKKDGIFPYNYVRKLSKSEFDQIKNKLTQLENGRGGGGGLRNSNENNNNNRNQENINSLNNSKNINLVESNSESSEDDDEDNSSKTTSQFFSETHMIASLSDPLESRDSKRVSSNSNFMDEAQSQQKIVQQPSSTSTPSQSPTSITIQLNDIVKEGYLVKKGHIRRNWNVRWFQLRKNRLTYAKSPNETKLNGELTLTRDTEVDIATNMKRTNCFQIKIPQGDNKFLIFYCSAQSPDEMEDWISSIKKAKNNS